MPIFLAMMKKEAGIQNALIKADNIKEAWEKIKHAPHYVSVKEDRVQSVIQITVGQADVMIENESAGWADL